jgi:hypothetical protein
LSLRRGDVVIFQYSDEPRMIMAIYNCTREKDSHLHKTVPPTMRKKYGKKALSKSSWYIQTYWEDPEFAKEADSYGWKPASIKLNDSKGAIRTQQ